MARFETSGMDEIIRELDRLGNDAEPVARRMLKAGAEKVKEAWKQAAKQHQLRDTGDMINSINYAREPKRLSGILTIDIYPQGKDRHGVRNAEKAFVLHYGTKKIKPTHWVDDADQMAAEPVQKEFERIWDDYLEGKETE